MDPRPLPQGLSAALSGDRAGLCGAVLSLCLHQLPPPPAEGYLPWCYRYLCAQLYPDGEVFDPALVNAVEEVYLPALCWALQHEDAPFDPLTDLLPLPEGAISESRVAEEYGRFQALVEEKRLMALLRIGRECMPFDTASHIIGVHNVALHAAILARAAGLPVDLPLVSAASLSHDVGKFGCRGADLKRIAYLHYYFTWTWLEEAGLPEIGHVAANHSTWDLEFENLPMESLLLIYADFRVRGTRVNGKEVMGIYSLSESRDMIFSKLADMTPQKQRRYETVYCKLRDFEAFLQANGVGADLADTTLKAVSHRDPALAHPSGGAAGAQADDLREQRAPDAHHYHRAVLRPVPRKGAGGAHHGLHPHVPPAPGRVQHLYDRRRQAEDAQVPL